MIITSIKLFTVTLWLWLWPGYSCPQSYFYYDLDKAVHISIPSIFSIWLLLPPKFVKFCHQALKDFRFVKHGIPQLCPKSYNALPNLHGNQHNNFNQKYSFIHPGYLLQNTVWVTSLVHSSSGWTPGQQILTVDSKLKLRCRFVLRGPEPSTI